jgi:hypothetical protein
MTVENTDLIHAPGSLESLGGTHHFQRFNPALGLTFLPSKAITAYAGYNEGSRAPNDARHLSRLLEHLSRGDATYVAPIPLQSLRASSTAPILHIGMKTALRPPAEKRASLVFPSRKGRGSTFHNR